MILITVILISIATMQNLSQTLHFPELAFFFHSVSWTAGLTKDYFKTPKRANMNNIKLKVVKGYNEKLLKTMEIWFLLEHLDSSQNALQNIMPPGNDSVNFL